MNGPNDACRGAVELQPVLSYEPTTADQFFVKLGFAIGNYYNWAASEVVYRLDTRLGDAHYRVMYDSEKFR